MQLTPNMTRLLIRWGLRDKLAESAVKPTKFCLRRYANGELLENRPGDNFERDFGSPYYNIHRADLHNMLLELATPYMTLRLNSQVLDVNPKTASVTLVSGEVLEADLLIGADGISSRVREVAFSSSDPALQIGDVAYRAVIQTSHMMKDPELKQLVEEAAVSLWLGPGRHIVGYCIRRKEAYNIVMIHPGKSKDERYADSAEIQAEFSEFEPRIRKLLKLVPLTLVWPVNDRKPLKTWVHEDNKVCLLGDSCHPMLPYRAQGAAMAVEDAAVLGNIFSCLSAHSQIPSFLKAYQNIRYRRATDAQQGSRKNREVFHLLDGPAQELRDASMRLAMAADLQVQGEAVGRLEENGSVLGRKNLLASFSYDADKEVDSWRASHGNLYGQLERTKL